MPVILTVTCEPTTVYHINNTSNKVYNYDKYNRITKNIFKNEYEVFYSGQNRGKSDYELTNAIENNQFFKVYYRPKKDMPFTYLGFTRNSSIVQKRTLPENVDTNPEQRLQIHLIINNIENISVPIINIFGSGRYKKDVLIHAGLRDVNNDKIIQHSKNNNIGFYYYSDSEFSRWEFKYFNLY